MIARFTKGKMMKARIGCLSCVKKLSIFAFLSGLMVTTGGAQSNSTSRAVEALMQRQAEAFALVDTLDGVSARAYTVLNRQRVLYHATANASTRIHYYSPWTDLQSHLETNNGNPEGNGGYEVSPGERLHGDAATLSLYRPRHRVCLVSGLNANTQMPDTRSNFGLLTYFDRGEYGINFDPEKIVSYAAAYASRPGRVEALPEGLGVISPSANGTTIEFVDAEGTSTTIPNCLADRTTWGELEGDRLAVYLPDVKLNNLRFVFASVNERRFGDEFTRPYPTGVGLPSGGDWTCKNLFGSPLEVGRPQYVRETFEELTGLTDDRGAGVAGQVVDSETSKAAWLVNDWQSNRASCREITKYTTVIEETCVFQTGSDGARLTTDVKRLVTVGVREIMPVPGTTPARYYYEDGETPTYEVDPGVVKVKHASACDGRKGLALDLNLGKGTVVSGDSKTPDLSRPAP